MGHKPLGLSTKVGSGKRVRVRRGRCSNPHPPNKGGKENMAFETCIRYKESKCIYTFRANQNCLIAEARHSCDRHLTVADKADDEQPDGNWGEPYRETEIEAWRRTHLRLMCKDPGSSIICCPRCHSLEIETRYPNITCRHCGYAEPLIDFGMSLGWEKFFEAHIV